VSLNNQNTTEKEPAVDPVLARKELRRNQVFGMVLGIIGGLMTANFWPVVQVNLGWSGAIVWGAAIGGIIGSLAQFERAGKILTRSENRMLNLSVGLAVPLLFLAVLAVVINALSS
jgi:hypothetical protein